jgi:hypothetical protein
MRLCVAEAIARVRYPEGADVLDVEVAVRWSAPDKIDLAARAVRHQTLRDL